MSTKIFYKLFYLFLLTLSLNLLKCLQFKQQKENDEMKKQLENLAQAIRNHDKKIKELYKEAGVISPADYQNVIDIFEKECER
tara:strand:+ start:811 stop:1059 length:249 start_codon:yes stop_codon:yes gene_type:complete